ncbi:glycosyltransferase [Microbacterium sp. GXF0217]
MPLVSFIIVSTDDQAAVERSLQSCLTQSLTDIEIVYVGPVRSASLKAALAEDRRTVVVAAPAESSAAQLRRSGVHASSAPFVLFIEPGDVVSRGAAKRLHKCADETRAQLICYAITTARADGKSSKSLPAVGPLNGPDILRHLVPRETRAGLEPWRGLFQKNLLLQAYAIVSDDTRLLADDRAIVLLAYALATSYASVDTVEYVRRAPKTNVDTARFRELLDQVNAFGSLAATLRERARSSPDPEPLLDGFAAGHLTVIAEALSTFASLPSDARVEEQFRLRDRIDELDATLAAVAFAPDTLASLVAYGQRLELGQAPVRNVLLTTNVLTTGGVSGVLLTQARILLDAGFRVIIATHRPGSAESLVPAGATLVQVTGTSRRQRVAQWAQLCRIYEVDVVIDHRILYSRDWPGFALAARATGARTVGWIHNFAARPTYNANDLQTVLQTHLGALAHLVVLSPLDVAFWKLRGIGHVSYLPNPPSPFLLEAGTTGQAKSAPQGRPLELIWWGRLEEHTKKVTQLVEVAAALRRLGVDYRLRIVGPEWADVTADRLIELASKRGIADRIELTGPRHGIELLETIDSADVFINTSIIEGYPLTLPEAQSRGLPIAMYDLPWLSLLQNNAGAITTPQQDPASLANAIADLAGDPQRYEAMSQASVTSSALATSYDFTRLYADLLQGTLSPGHSPEPTLEDGRQILELLAFFAERSTPPPTAAGSPSPARARPAQRRRPHHRTFAQRIERRLTPIGHRVVDSAPWLQPAASKIKRVLLRR